MNLTGFGEAEAVDSLREVVNADVLRFAAVLEELLRRNTHTRSVIFNCYNTQKVKLPVCVTGYRPE